MADFVALHCGVTSWHEGPLIAEIAGDGSE